MIKHVLDLVELELCTPAAPPMWSIRLQGQKRLVDQLTLERWHILIISLVPLFSGEFKFYWASSTSNALAHSGEWYNRLVIHTAQSSLNLNTLIIGLLMIILKYKIK